MNLKEALLAFATTPEDAQEWGENRGVRRPDWPYGWYVSLASAVGESDAVYDGTAYRKLYYPTLMDIVADDWEVAR